MENSSGKRKLSYLAIKEVKGNKSLSPTWDLMSLVCNVSHWDTDYWFHKNIWFSGAKTSGTHPQQLYNWGLFHQNCGTSASRVSGFLLVTTVFMIRKNVSLHLLQNIRSCLKDKFIPERDANTEWDGSQCETEEDPRRVRGDEVSWCKRRQRRGWKETESVDSLCWKGRKIQCLLGDNDCRHNPVLTPEMTVIIAPCGHWKESNSNHWACCNHSFSQSYCTSTVSLPT